MRCAALVLLTLSLAVLPGVGCRKAGPAVAEKAPARFHCPMHPSYVSDRKGSCPICGMDLVLVPEASAPPPGGVALPTNAEITIDPERRQLIGLRSVKVRRAPFSAMLRTTGRVTYDEARIHHVHTKYEAYIERLYADFTGRYVKKGDPLLSLYSPEILAAEQEYLLLLRSRSGAAGPELGADLVKAARQKLLLWNISAADIAALERRGEPRRTFELYAPMSGYILNKTAVHGMRIRPEDSLFDIVDLSRLWVLADVYEYELPRVQIGQRATMTLTYWPGRSWEGKLTYIYPSVDPKTRTIKVRLEVDNSKGELKAEMFADVLIRVAPREALVVPDDAVLESGSRRLVFLLLGEGRLLPREIVTGDRAEHLYEVRSGLREGDEVASGATFLVDSESRLQAALSTMTPAAPPDGGGP